mgnify:CR=1 FL=1|jgi:hypothetical protein
MRKELIKEDTSFPAFDIWQGKEVWLDCTDDLDIDCVHHADSPMTLAQNYWMNLAHGMNGLNALVIVNQPSRDLVNRYMLVVSVDVDDWEEGS